MEYKTRHTKVKIVCKSHGCFWQTPGDHYRGRGCKKCAKNVRKTNRQALKDFRQVHQSTYDYAEVHYKGAHTPVKIRCHQHGIFLQSPTNHLQGQGCPACKCSKGERAISEKLENLGVTYTREKSFPNLSSRTSPYRFDFFLPEHKILIEFDGKQHYDPHDNWFTFEIQKRDNIKTRWAKENGYTLYRFRQIEAIDCLHTLLKDKSCV